MSAFIETWHKAAVTSLGLFWMAFWAFGLGYVISSMIQVFVTRARMRQSMGQAGTASVAKGTFFGFISSSCSFAALATTRSLFAKGAGLIPSLAFLLASTNLVIELGIVIAVFLSWQFVLGEYLGGLLLIAFMWLGVRLTYPKKLVETARENARSETESEDGTDTPDWKQLIRSRDGWRRVANKYVMEWKMVWKDVAIGFTVAGSIAAFVPQSFFEALFVGAGQGEPAFWQVLIQAVIGPIAAFITFIGSMGNIPLAGVLYANGVSFAGVMAFIFSDLVVFPVLRIQAEYYGWKMALYIMGVFFVSLVASAVLMHYGFSLAGILPEASGGQSMVDREFFKLNYTFVLNIAFLLISIGFIGWWWRSSSGNDGESSTSLKDKVLLVFAGLAFLWLTGGLIAPLAL